MCSIAMPAELILGHSPPVYRPFLYGPLVVTSPPITNRSVPPRIRPCLSSGSLPINGPTNDTDVGSKQKKKVVFADDRGRPLTQVRVMSEPSNVPPLWSNGLWSYLTGLSNGSLRPKEEEDRPPSVHWQLSFPQPASDYLAFRQKLDQENVCLENVIVRESEQCLLGTVKVRNLAYDKEVIVRTSSDSWKTHEDVHCSYVKQPGPSSAYVLYDTFRFRLTLPLNSDHVEFCVRYRTDEKEYWDNNDNHNYNVQRRQEVRSTGKRYDVLHSDCSNDLSGLEQQQQFYQQQQSSVPTITDATRVNLRTWSEFASWQHLSNDTPYW